MTEELSQASEAGAEEVTASAVEQAQEEQQPQQGVAPSDADGGEAEAAGDDVAENQDADGV